MNLFRITIANQTIEVEAGYNDTSSWCRDFITDNQPDYIIRMQQQDIVLEEKLLLHNNPKAAPSRSYLEFIALLRKLSDRFIDYRTVLIHGAAISLHGDAYIFSAPSKTGKTTHILKWVSNCPDTIVINGDKPFLKINDDGTVLVCGSPWAGKENMYTNTMVPLNAIILMERSENNHITQISFDEAFPTLLQQTYRPESIEKMRKTLKLLQRINSTVKFYRFQCNNFKDDCFDVAYNALIETDEFPAC